MTEEKAFEGPQKIYCPPGYAENVVPTHARNFLRDAGMVRAKYAEYFFSENGQVAWQWDIPGVKKPNILKTLI